MISALPVSGAWVPNTIGAHGLRPRISLISVSLTAPKPCPPSSGPRCGAHRPWSRTCCLSGSTILRRSSFSGKNSQPGNNTSSGSTSSWTNSRIQSSFFANSGSVEKSHAMSITPRSEGISGKAAVDPQYRAGAEAGCVRCQKQCTTDDFGRVTRPLQRQAAERVVRWLVQIPRLADVGEEGAGHQGVDPDLRPECPRKALGHRVEPGLRRGVGDDVGCRAQRARGADVDDRPAAGRDHSLTDQRGQPKWTLEVEIHHRVEQLLGDIGQL